MDCSGKPNSASLFHCKWLVDILYTCIIAYTKEMHTAARTGLQCDKVTGTKKYTHFFSLSLAFSSNHPQDHQFNCRWKGNKEGLCWLHSYHNNNTITCLLPSVAGNEDLNAWFGRVILLDPWGFFKKQRVDDTELIVTYRRPLQTTRKPFHQPL